MTAGHGERAADEPEFMAPAFTPLDLPTEPIAPTFADDETPDRGRATTWIALSLALVLAVVWTAFFVWSQRAGGAIDVRTVPALIAQWAVPMLLLGVGWLMFARGGTRNADRLGRAARELDAQSRQLEARLAAVNGELSLAREFIVAQSRDLESIGRLAAERLNESGQRLQQLVIANAERIETIAGTSGVALGNMEQLRAQLPVLTTATRDLSNTIGSAGQTAQGQLGELHHALEAIGQAGAVNAGQVAGLRRSVSETIDEFTRRADQLATIAATRFEALGTHGDAIRAQLEAGESEALGALAARAYALRSEGERIAAALRDGETAALARWRESVSRIEADVGGALVVLDNAERDAFAASHQRLLSLSDDAERIDALLDERARTFALALDGRRDAAAAADEQALVLFARRLDELDAEIGARQAAQARQGDQLADYAEAVANRLAQSETRMAGIVAQAREARDTLDAHVRELIASLADGRETLSGVDGDVRGLITSSERVRDLLGAAAADAHEHLPGLLADGEARIRALHEAIGALRSAIGETSAQGEQVAGGLTTAATDVSARLAEIADRQSSASADAIAHLGHLEAIDERLQAIVAAEGSLSDRARSDFAETLKALVRDMTESGATAFDRALRNAASQTAGRIEQAAAHAAGVGGEAASQLRAEIAHVEQQTTALEARIAAAQARTEAPLDRDFARRAALITETLNSNAIDIAGALAQDQPDTAWAAYLRGDRGVFTRRAVRLLDGGQSRGIVSIYEADPAFRDHVSRYIHDFEAILRELLSARDGHVLAVTMLSSDMGKLYVALAQAIERLRN